MSARHKVGIGMATLVALAASIVFASRPLQPHLTMAMVSRTPKEGFVECVIGLTNDGANVTYRGYSKQSPIYARVHDTPAGPITNSFAGCGLGLV